MLLLLLFACDPGAQATDLCRDRRAALDALYGKYGGSDLAEGTKGGLFGDAIGEADRARFEESCVELGKGGRPKLMAQKAKDFFAAPETKAACERVVNLENKVAALNRELPAEQQVTCP